MVVLACRLPPLRADWPRASAPPAASHQTAPSSSSCLVPPELRSFAGRTPRRTARIVTPHAGKAAGSGAGKSAPPPPPAKPSKQLFVSASDGQLPPLPEALAKTCGAVYAALGVASAAAGGALTVAAVRGPHQLLPPALHGDALAATMVTLVPALLLHSSGALLFLAGGCAAGELATARYQRVNVALAACAACVLLVQATGVQHASGLLVGSLSALSVSTLAVCAWVLRSMLAAGPIALLGAWRLGDGTAAHNLAAGAVYFARDVSSLPGFMCVAGLALSAIAGALLLVAPGAGLGAAPPPVDAPASLLPLLLYTRRLVGCSLLLAASSFHALLEAAAERRSLAPAAEATIGVLRGLAKDDARFKRLHPGAMRFALLALGVAAAGVLQGWVTLRAPSLGVALSGADPQWASLHWLLLPVAAVCLSFVRPADWPQLGSLLGGALSSVNAALAFLFSHLVFRPEWVTRSRT